jgi:hypothetical protein
MNAWTIALLPLGGVFLGALLQSWLGRKAEIEKRVELLRSEAYADFLKAVAAAGHLRSDDEQVAASRAIADAKARIAVYGSATVIRALAKFDQGGAVLDNENSAARFVALVSAMRPDEGKNLSQDISIALLGPSRGKQ